MSPRVIAALDIGTNSVLLTIARVEADGAFSLLDQRATVTRLGQDVDRTATLHPAAQERTLACLRDYRAVMTAAGVDAGLAVGTSALRDARGAGDFLAAAEQVLGFRPEVISGNREAELTFVGALSGLDPQMVGNRGVLVFDIGGGSTELILGTTGDSGRRCIQQCTSLDIGSVRLTERNALSDPPTHNQLMLLREQVRNALKESGMSVQDDVVVVGVAGTVTTLAAISERMTTYDGAHIHGHLLKRAEISRIVAHLAGLSLEQRLQVPGLSKGRADVIVAGSILCEELIDFACANELVVSDRGVRFGLLAEMMA